MKQGSNNKRPRRGGAPKGNRGPVRNQTFDSNGPGIRVRGNAQQVMEKYLALARDAASSGDRILAENYYQHAEHYFRIANVNGALTQRVQQGGMHAQQTPAHDHSVLDDLFEYEEEAALQQVNGGHGDHSQQHGRSYDQQGDDEDGGDEQPRHNRSYADGERGGDDQGERQGRNRRQRGRRGGRDRNDRYEGTDADAAPQQAQPQAEMQQPAPAQPEAPREAAPEQPAAPAPAEPPAAEAEAPAPKAPRRTRAKAAPQPVEGEGGEDQAAAPRRRRTTRRKAADTADGEGETSEPREAVA